MAYEREKLCEEEIKNIMNPRNVSLLKKYKDLVDLSREYRRKSYELHNKAEEVLGLILDMELWSEEDIEGNRLMLVEKPDINYIIDPVAFIKRYPKIASQIVTIPKIKAEEKLDPKEYEDILKIKETSSFEVIINK